MDTRQLIASLFATIATVTVLLAPVACTMYESKRIADSPDPLATRCGMMGSGSSVSAICIIKAQQGAK
jgi:hypothetical protein